MKLSKALLESKELTFKINQDINGLTFPQSDRAKLSAALLDQVHEHHKAFIFLLEKALCGSASSIVRVAFETMIRGIWIFRCASNEGIEIFKSDKIKGLDSLISEIDSVLETNDGELKTLKDRIYSPLCSYTHGGYLQAVRRISSDEISPNYDDEEMLEALKIVDFCLFLSTIEIFSIANRQDLSSYYSEKFKNTYSCK